MALINCKFYSETLLIHTEIMAIIPQQPMISQERVDADDPGLKHKVLYLLHGLSDDHTAWTRQTSIERYANEYNIAVIMPAVNRSFYTDLHYGAKYWTFMTEELPLFVRRMFPISSKREDNYVAGLSMGGYGAFKLALRHPERFNAAASLSGALDLAPHRENLAEIYTQMYGNIHVPLPTEDDLIQLLSQRDPAELPRLYQCCGTEDFLYEDNIRFRDVARQHNIALHYEEEPGDHEWGYWDKKIQSVLSWMFK